ncbi:SRPBCC family protein [Roseivirga sp. E12]|uniref:SRPBCC family protein n=1 Tax=Roseivirga sp. E12 TaxID=2819237 RepID=UPI001ABC5DD1|nr:SRPBCC family protein [Roseivirga sp. E12]MBO3697034.1 SRPBCC family protein [Roseivirga sp. E12]
MEFKTDIQINASKEKVWSVISDIENAKDNISAIESIEVLEPPTDGLLGLKWKETRTMFGKQATEIMWITEASENEYYQTRAESHGAIYISRLWIEENGSSSTLNMSFNGTPVTFGAKVMSAVMGWMFKSATVKALNKDLEDIKRVAEGKSD